MPSFGPNVSPRRVVRSAFCSGKRSAFNLCGCCGCSLNTRALVGGSFATIIPLGIVDSNDGAIIIYTYFSNLVAFVPRNKPAHASSHPLLSPFAPPRRCFGMPATCHEDSIAFSVSRTTCAPPGSASPGVCGANLSLKPAASRYVIQAKKSQKWVKEGSKNDSSSGFRASDGSGECSQLCSAATCYWIQAIGIARPNCAPRRRRTSLGTRATTTGQFLQRRKMRQRFVGGEVRLQDEGPGRPQGCS